MKKKLILLLAFTFSLGLFYFIIKPRDVFLPFPLADQEIIRFNLSKELNKQGIGLKSSIAWNNNSMGFEAVLENGIKVIFSSEISPNSQISSLQLILKKSKMISSEGQGIKSIDLRTLNPYVSF
ncbi:MAG: hypothetical protein ABIB61_02635 [Candidatus Shapirobacteria bacterium]